MTEQAVPITDEQAAIVRILSDDGWICDVYGHEPGDPCSDCARAHGQTAARIVAEVVAPLVARAEDAERERDAARVRTWCAWPPGADLRRALDGDDERTQG